MKEDQDAENRRIIGGNIEKFGCSLAILEPDNYLPGFVYSIGLFEKYKHPEIICFGLHVDVMSSVINHAASLISQGNILQLGKPYSGFLDGFDIQFVDVQEEFYKPYLGYGMWYYRYNSFPVIQLVWPDKDGLFPWDRNFYKEWKFKQPLLDRNIDFFFYEERNLGVYTTKQVLDGADILYVYHNTDGDWQFHSESDPRIEDGVLVCLEEVVKLDSSVNEIFDLQYGWKASRTEIKDQWMYEEI